MPNKVGKFSEQEERFTKALAETGDASYAGYVAGYKSRPSAIVAKANDPAIRAALQALRLESVSELFPISTDRLREALEKGFNTRAQMEAIKIIRTEAKDYGDITGAGDKEDHELSLGELIARRDRLELEVKALELGQVEDAEIVDDSEDDDLFA